MKFLNSTVGGNSLILPSVSVTPSVQAASFNGSNFINVAFSELASDITGDFSIFCWIKTTDSSSFPGIVYIGNGTLNQGVFLSIVANSISCLVTGVGNVVVGFTTINDGAWHFVGVVSSSGVYQIYIDGSASGNPAENAPLSLSGTSAYIGYASGYGNLTGDISEVAIFNRALSGGEITTLFNNGYGLYGNVALSPWNSGLVAGYHLNGDFNDYSGNNFNGINTGGVTFDAGFIISTITVDPSWTTILVDTSTYDNTINLGTAVGNTGRVHVIKDNNGYASINNITISPQNGQTIDANTSQIIAYDYGSITLQSDGTNWQITNQNPPDTLAAGIDDSVSIVGQLTGYNTTGATTFAPIPEFAGTGASTAGSFGTDTNGLINLWSGTSSGGYGPIVSVTFSNPLPYEPIVHLQPANPNSSFWFGPGQVYIPYEYTSHSGFYLGITGSGYGPFTGITDNSQYQWYYFVSGAVLPPQDNLTAWYRADSIAQSNDSLVATWEDQSGNGWHLTSSSGYQPIFKTNIQNGLPAVKFIGTTNSSYSNYVTNNSLNIPPVCTIYTVLRPVTVCNDATSNGVNTIFADDHSETAGSIVSNNWNLYDGVTLTGDTVAAEINYLFVSVFDESNSYIYSNGAVVANGEAGANSSTGFIMGSDSTYAAVFDGYIMEMLIYNTNSYDPNVAKYLNRKWKIY